MNSKQPELTIFQGVPSIHLDNNKNRPEEDEAIEDQKRRQAEIQLELEKEFNNYDFEEDDANQSFNSTANHSRYPNSSAKNILAKDFPLRSESDNLSNQLDARNREIEHINMLLSEERKKHKQAVDEYEKRLKISESEKERALMNRNQSHELLVENKGEIIKLRDENQCLMSKIKSLEHENENLIGELESTKLMLSDTQTKYNMVEKNVLFNAERNTDLILKQAQERHSAQTAMMQQQIDGLKSKLDDMEHDYKHLDIRYKELQRSREVMLIEKSEVINQLNKNLEESQRQCQDLLSRPDLTQENKRLHHIIKSVEYQRDELSDSVNKLRKKVQEQSQELEMMDSIVVECDGNNQSYSEISKFHTREGIKNVKASSTPMSPEVRLSKVKDELCKSLSNIKQKREEIKILEKQLAEKDQQLEAMKRDESKLLMDLNNYRDNVVRLESKISMLEKQLNKTQHDLSAASENNGNSVLQKELENKKEECDKLALKIENMLQEQIMLSEKVQAQRVEMEKMQNEVDEKKLPCKKCEDNVEKIQKLEMSNLEFQNVNADYLTELSSLKHELADAHDTIEIMQEKLNLQNLRDQEIERLKEKAKEFENYMRSNKSHNSKGSSQASSLNASLTKADAATETESDENECNRRNSYHETKVRDEMARIFANQIKIVEKQFREEAKKLQNQIMFLTGELEEKSKSLQLASEQLELLKFTIVHEREDFQKILKENEEHFNEAADTYRTQIHELHEKASIIDEERASIKTLKAQIDIERTEMDKKEEQLSHKLKKLQQESSKIIEDLSEKYKSAKKTALNYKQYSEDKEKHYRNECERIKNGYAEAVEKIQIRVKETLQQKERNFEEKLKKIEQEYEFKINFYKGMLEKAQD